MWSMLRIIFSVQLNRFKFVINVLNSLVVSLFIASLFSFSKNEVFKSPIINKFLFSLKIFLQSDIANLLKTN